MMVGNVTFVGHAEGGIGVLGQIVRIEQRPCVRVCVEFVRALRSGEKIDLLRTAGPGSEQAACDGKPCCLGNGDRRFAALRGRPAEFTHWGDAWVVAGGSSPNALCAGAVPASTDAPALVLPSRPP